MNPFRKAERSGMVASESGQMAVFVALIFQVLFVFFAMVVNIGLLVHDKINLQNAVDLGAYYGAQRQAEMLNEIAALNYQIRQDYKLLSWRLRVLGAFGRVNHPQNSLGPYADAPMLDPSISEYPAFCIAHPGWEETRRIGPMENMCQLPINQTIPQIPAVPIIIDFGGINAAVSSIINGLRSGFEGRCDSVGPMNWAFGSTVMTFFRYAVRSRKEMINVLAVNASQPIQASGGFLDQETQPVYKGIEETIRRNLTQANKSGFTFEAINGLAQGSCGQIVDRYPNWLREITINPVLTYSNFEQSGGGCSPITMALEQVPGIAGVPGDPAVRQAFDPNGVLLANASGEPSIPGDPFRSSRGFEKNPWCMAYVGVKATSRPRKPFSPFGAPIQLVARSFAQPFGGRVGPWDKRGWAPGAPISSGDAVDRMAVPRTNPGLPPPNRNGQAIYVPNYSRYPGDQLGLRSIAALAATRPSLNAQLQAPNARRISLNDYAHVDQIAQTGDVLAWDSVNKEGPFVRLAETAAVTPDLFDAAYYSIEPDFYRNYYNIAPAAVRFPSTTANFRAISDVGSQIGHPGLTTFGIRDQIFRVFAGGALLPDATWVISDKQHLLTSWTQNGAVDYSFPTQYFGVCNGVPTGREPASPGDCFAGGRTGYSVRLIHREYLLFGGHRLGGADGATAPIMNPPAPNF